MAFYIHWVEGKNRAETKKIKNLIPRQKKWFGVLGPAGPRFTADTTHHTQRKSSAKIL